MLLYAYVNVTRNIYLAMCKIYEWNPGHDACLWWGMFLFNFIFFVWI